MNHSLLDNISKILEYAKESLDGITNQEPLNSKTHNVEMEQLEFDFSPKRNITKISFDEIIHALNNLSEDETKQIAKQIANKIINKDTASQLVWEPVYFKREPNGFVSSTVMQYKSEF